MIEKPVASGETTPLSAAEKPPARPAKAPATTKAAKRQRPPSIDAVHRTCRQLDASRQSTGDEIIIGVQEILGKRERPVSLPRRSQHHVVAAFDQHCDHAVEVARLGDVVDEEQDAHAVRGLGRRVACAQRPAADLTPGSETRSDDTPVAVDLSPPPRRGCHYRE